MENNRENYKKQVKEELQHLLDTLAENSNSELEAYRNLGYILGVEYHPVSDSD